MSKQIVWDMLKHYSRPIPGVSFNEAELRADYPNGSRIQLFGADNPDALRGLGLWGVVMDEFSQMPSSIFTEVIRPALSDHEGYAIFIGTPQGKNAFYSLYHDNLENKAWYVRLLRASESGIIPNEELEDAKIIMSSDEYMQEFECFPPNTFVATSRGNKLIKDIRIGDMVLTHRNRWRPVIKTMQRKYSGELISVKAYGMGQTFRVTPEHPFLVYNKSTASRSWKKAKEIKIDDFLILPKIRKARSIISEDWIKIIAWFICEGSVTGNTADFSLNPSNEIEINEVTSILERLGYEPRAIKNGVLSVCDVTLAGRLVGWCGSGAGMKRIPFDMIAGHEEKFFEELMKGDGCLVQSVQGGHRWAYTTISKGLAYDVQLLAACLGRRAGIVVRPARESVIQGRVVKCRESYCLQIPKGKKVNHSRIRESFPTKLGIAFRVRECCSVFYCGTVYNLSVKKDESYVANGRAVHNCSFTAAIKGAYYSVQLDEARRFNRIGNVPYNSSLPVMTYWDLGMNDQTTIIFAQKADREIRVIDYYENSGAELAMYASELQGKGYNYKMHYVPHDIKVRELGTGRSRYEILSNLLGTDRIAITPDLPVKDGIEAVRRLFPRIWFDEKKCAPLLDALGSYTQEWDDRKGMFRDKPLHNWASHASDSMRYMCVAFKEDMTIKVNPIKSKYSEGYTPKSFGIKSQYSPGFNIKF